MAIEERKGKKGITFRIVAYAGYKLNKNGNYVQNRKTKTFRPPTRMTLREAHKTARQLDIEFTNQFAKEQASGTNMTLSEVWEWYKKYYAPNYLRTFNYLYNANNCRKENFTWNWAHQIRKLYNKSNYNVLKWCCNN